MVLSGIIYCATCATNGKKYVGQTCRPCVIGPEALLERRRGKHEATAARGSRLPFHSAIRKYGAATFAWEILESLADIDALNSREEYYINTLRTLHRSHGYNAMHGGLNRTGTTEMRARMAAFPPACMAGLKRSRGDDIRRAS